MFCAGGGSGLGGGRIGRSLLHYTSTFPDQIALHRVSQICATYITVANRRSLIEIAGALLAVKGNISPYHKETSSNHWMQHKPCIPAALAQFRIGLPNSALLLKFSEYLVHSS